MDAAPQTLRPRFAATSDAPEQPGRVVKRHSVAVRLAHWIGAFAFVLLVMSGFQIFNAAPYLDASDYNNPAHRVLAIGSKDGPNGAHVGVTNILGHEFVTTHVLGYGDDGQGGESTRAFPGWLTWPAYQDLAGARSWHFFFGWVMATVGIVYFINGLLRRDLGLLVVRPSDFPKMWPMQAYYLRLRKEPPEHGKYNPLQKAGYTVVLFVLCPFVILTGLALSPGVDSAVGPLTSLLGGRQFARLWHFLATIALVGFLFGHVFLVLSTGFRNNMRSMTLGTYRLGKNEGTGK
jgi:Ni/Fe-hydrogenase b-type cytochrome subunit